MWYVYTALDQSDCAQVSTTDSSEHLGEPNRLSYVSKLRVPETMSRNFSSTQFRMENSFRN